MSWLFSQALVAEYLEGNCSDGELSVQLKSTTIAQAYLQEDKMKDFSRLSQFGMTFAPLTENLGEGLLMWFLGGFRAKTSVLPEKKQSEYRGKGLDCGKSLPGWFAKYDHDTCLWKIPQTSLFAGLTSSSVIWPEWGSMQNGVCWARTPLVQRRYERGHGLLPALVLTDHKGSTPLQVKRRERKGNGWTLREWLARYSKADSTVYPHPGFLEKVMGWPTGWTELKPLETDKFRHALQRRSDYCQSADNK